MFTNVKNLALKLYLIDIEGMFHYYYWGWLLQNEVPEYCYYFVEFWKQGSWIMNIHGSYKNNL
jgi:hypothetical protein